MYFLFGFFLVILLTMLMLPAVPEFPPARVIPVDFSPASQWYSGGFNVYIDAKTYRGFVFQSNSGQSSVIIGRKEQGIIEISNSNGHKTFVWSTIHTLVGDPESPTVPVLSRIISVNSLVKRREDTKNVWKG